MLQLFAASCRNRLHRLGLPLVARPGKCTSFLLCQVNGLRRKALFGQAMMEPRGTRVYGMHGFASLDARASPRAGNESRDQEEDRLDAAQVRELDRFLAGVERRAFRIAQCALRDTDDAHDVVQVAMLRLAQSYATRPVDEWKPLFYRILNNGIRDFLRRRRVRMRVMAWLPRRTGDEEGLDPVEAAPDPAGGPRELLEGAEALAALETGLAALPERQREAFMLRALEGLDVAGTAIAMGCSEGSVKTHYFRAVHALKDRLGE